MAEMAAAKKTVAVIGGGPAGLTTAKALLEAGLDAHIFEAKSDVGGLWAVSEASSTLTCQPNMRTNLSRWTCSFSDLNWKEKHFQNVKEMKEHGYDSLPIFPQARDVHSYLKDYAARYVPSEKISLGTRVVHVSQLADRERKTPSKWHVEWETAVDARTNRPRERESGVFDHIAVASGFFSAPHIPAIPGLENFKGNGQIFHSSNYHDLLHASRQQKQGKKIVVVGGCLSSVEVVCDLLLNREHVEVVHLFPKPFWVLPRYFRVPEASLGSPPSFLPLDLVLYDGYQRRSAQGLVTRAPVLTQEENNLQANEFMRSQAGNGDQASLSTLLKIGPEEMRLPPYVAISDYYANFVRSGDVTLERGYLSSIKQDPQTGLWNCLELSSVCPSAGVSNDSVANQIAKTLIHSVDVIVFATGYKPTMSFPHFLPQEILEELAYQPDDNFLPVLLYNQILHPSLISYSSDTKSTIVNSFVHAGFVGMYKGPSFGVMESQARYLAGLFKGSIKPPPKAELEREIADFRVLREGRRSGKLEVRGQWSWGDYLGIMEELEGRLAEGKPPNPPRPEMARGGIDKAIEMIKETKWGGICAPVIPAHFAHTSEPEAQQAISDLLEISGQAMKGARFVAKAVFRSLHGTWRLTRTLKSRLNEMPSGSFEGIAKFLPRGNTFRIMLPESEESELICSLKRTRLADGAEGSRDEIEGDHQGDNSDITEYIYSEHGTFTLSTPPYFSFPAVRKYIYRYHPGTDSISVWFVKPQLGSVPSSTSPSAEDEMEGEVDYLFHEVEFLNEAGAQGERMAKGKEHLCEKDLYKARYKFRFGDSSHRGPELSQFCIGYDVRGPKKDYSSEGIFKRG